MKLSPRKPVERGSGQSDSFRPNLVISVPPPAGISPDADSSQSSPVIARQGIFCYPLEIVARTSLTYGSKTELETLACARELLESQNTMTLATVDDHGQPYATPLFYLPRPDLTLCWLSTADSRHSLNLRGHARASVAVYAAVNRWEEIRGVQMEGAVQEILDSEERRETLAAYRQRFRLGTVLSLAIAKATLYSFRPSWIRYLDNARGFGYKSELTL